MASTCTVIVIEDAMQVPLPSRQQSSEGVTCTVKYPTQLVAQAMEPNM